MQLQKCVMVVGAKPKKVERGRTLRPSGPEGILALDLHHAREVVIPVRLRRSFRHSASVAH